MILLKLLNSKNNCLRKFLQVSEAFLASSATTNLDSKSLTRFETERDAILKAIDLFDRKIAEAVSNIKDEWGNEERQPHLSEIVERLLNERREIVDRIVLVDNQILERIERERESIQKDMLAAQKNSNTLKKFKSGWVGESGGELDEKL